MLSFFKYVFATIIGIFILMFIGFISIFFLIPTEKAVNIKDGSVLEISLEKDITERTKENPLADLNPLGGSSESIGLKEIKTAIRKAKNDDKIKGILIKTSMSGVGAGYATLEEIRNELIEFKKSKKFIYAYGELYEEATYYLTSVADKIYLNPAGMMELNGLTSQKMFVKGTLEKLEVKPEIFRVGEFKSAVEMFLLDKMSDANRKQTESYLNSIYDHFLAEVAKSRNIPLEDLRNISNEMLLKEPKDAIKYKIATDLAYYDEVETQIKKDIKLKESDKIPFVSITKYADVKNQKDNSSSENKIAVLVAEGEINSGKSGDNNIGSETVVEELKKLRNDKKVKAIVLRINSPGGSALASDVMWREIQITKKVKPVIASMSDVAASGGYYMAMGCDVIVAQPNTITGSIGIFGVLMNTEKMLKNKLGITYDRVNTGKFSDLGDPTREMREDERKIIQTMVERGYEEFTSKAAQGRNMPLEDLKKVASGRVWSGKEAKERKLVDELGGLDLAIKIAAEKAKLKSDDYKLRYYPIEVDFFEKLTNKLMKQTQISEKILEEKLGELYPYLKMIEYSKKQDLIQARLPYNFSIK
ncbi:MAG: signal peptide peptidase SppA [Bacteroidetes bacterium]|nr:MAG: signal peptide peptidase SppA [Bacteroidota bacterium]TAG88545.1 MAG: signal peptide peptidase SppA [Bacteroidota bacterium]